MGETRVSVIIPAHNAGRFVVHAVESALAQSAGGVEVIVVDDGSTDGTRQRLAPCRDRICYAYQPRAGAAAARNHGARLARGRWLAFLDADDFWYSHKLADQLSLTERRGDLDIVMTNYHIVDETGRIAGEAFADHPMLPTGVQTADGIVFGAESVAAYGSHRFGITSTMFVRSELFHRLGGFCERFEVAEDIHFMYRAVAGAAAFGAVLRPGGAYRKLSGSASRQDAERKHRITLEALEDLVCDSHCLPRQMADAIRKQISETRMDLAYLLARQGRRAAATWAVTQDVLSRPTRRAMRALVSVNRPVRSRPQAVEDDPVAAFLFGATV